MSIISWGKLPSINITLFIFIFLSVFACFILGIIIYFFSEKVQDHIGTLAKIGTIITVICLILSILVEITISIGFAQSFAHYCNGKITVESKVYVGFFVFKRGKINSGINSGISSPLSGNINKRLLKYDDDCYDFFLTTSVYGMTYFTLSIIEIMCILGCCFWSRIQREFTSNPEIFYQNNNTDKNNNNNNQQGINIQTPQVIIINQNNNNGQVIQNQQNDTLVPNNKNADGNNNYNYPEQHEISKGNNNNNNLNINYPSQSMVFNSNEEKKNYNQTSERALK